MKFFSKLIVFLLVLSLSLSFYGCREASQSNEDWGQENGEENQEIVEDVTIRVMHYWPEHAETFDLIKNKFEEKEKHIKIEYSTSDYANMQSALKSAWMGGTMPDVYGYWAHQMREILVPGEDFMAADLTDAIMKDEEFMKLFKNKKSWDLSKIGDGTYCMPFRSTGFVIYYNKTVFEQNNWEKPKSIEEFGTLLKNIVDADLGVRPFYTYAANGTFMFIWKALFAYYDVLSGRTQDKNYNLGRLDETDADRNSLALAMNKIRSWAKMGAFGTSPLDGMEDAGQTSFVNGNCLLAMLNNNLLLEIQKSSSFKVGVMTLPAPQEFNNIEGYNSEYGYSFGGYDGFCVSSSSTKKAAAKKFMQFLASNEIQQLFAERTNSIMVNPNVSYTNAAQQEMATTMNFTGLYDPVCDFNKTSSHTASEEQISHFCAGSDAYGNASEILSKRYTELKKALKNKMYNNPALDVIANTYTVNSARVEAFQNWCKS